MFERLTDRARRVIVLAQEEARMLNHGHLGTEHILLGLIRDGEGVATQLLGKVGADLPTVEREVIRGLREERLDEGPRLPDEDLMGDAPFPFSNQGEELRALLRDIAQRLERIERRLAIDDPAP